MDIHILPQNIANMIAAGEVVQRPASVVKELVENAVDAGATKINVITQDAGRTLIQVIDNGCGMDPDQAVLCFQRHATSKISDAQDLQTIETYGFRGEALPSIAAVAEVTLKTRTADMDVASQITIDSATATEPGRQDVTSVAAPIGTNIAVRNLFYNTPARRKFLKSDNTERSAIVQEIQRVALAHPDLSFSLTENERTVFSLSPAASLQFRIRDLFGKSVSDELFPIEVSTSTASVSGFISRPETAKKNGACQFFFVNGRYFRSPYLHKAVMKGYENLLPEGTSPSYFIYIGIDSHAIDVNVHPTKTEIKFEDDNVLFTIVMAAVRQSLGRSAISDTLDFESGNMPVLHNVGPSFGEIRDVTEPSVSRNGNFNPFDTDGFPNETVWTGKTRYDIPAASGPFKYGDKPGLESQDFGTLLDMQQEIESKVEENLSKPVIRCGKYVVITGKNTSVVVIDSFRAMQRILFEHFLEALSYEQPVAQSTLFPVEVEVGTDNIPILTGNSEMLRRLGFVFEQFSPTSILVSALPEGLIDDKMTVSALVYEIINTVSEERASLAASLYSNLAGKLASSASRCTSLPSNDDMARRLIRDLYNCENPEFTSDGHPVVKVLKTDDLDKIFK